jgi:hypothetical protein
LALASFDSDAIDAVRKVLSARTFPDVADFDVTLNLIGLIALRNPRSRETFNQARSKTLHMLGDLLGSNRRIFDSHASSGGCGIHHLQKCFFESVKKFVEDRPCTIEFHPQDNSCPPQKFDLASEMAGGRNCGMIMAC